MKIVKLNEISERIVNELRKIGSNDQGKLVDLNLVDIDSRLDFSERNLIIGDSEGLRDVVDGFIDACREKGKKSSVICFGVLDFGILRKLSENTDEILLVGGNLNREGIVFVSEHKIRRISLNRFLEDIQETTELIMEFASGRELLLVFDFSILDDTGLSARQAIYILGRMGLMKNLNAAYFCCGDASNAGIYARIIAELF